ncbi:MAG TPA: glycosyltransferase family A protein [Urbifossiella sp.]|nr:glycosyltransferase family A protein [Urbifossiella sp.]
MRVSVVIPTYNSGPLVVEAVESALGQTAPPHEVIVVDDGSTDDTADRLARFGGRVRYVRQANARVAAARNAGLRAATGDAVAFLDADDAWHPEKLARQTAALAADPSLGLLATRVFPWPGPYPDPGVSPDVKTIQTEAMLPVNPITTSSVLVRRTVLDQAGEFDRELFGPEDYDLWLRCSRVAGVGILQQPLTGYRDTPASLGKQAETMYKGLIQIHQKLADAGMWAGRPWFRRKCQAHVEYTTAYLHYAGGRPARAAGLMLRSLATYPAPLRPPDVRRPWSRVRLLLSAVGAATTRLVRSGRAQAARPTPAAATTPPGAT